MLTVPGIAADSIYSGTMSNSGEHLQLRDVQNNLIDSIDSWYAGVSASRAAA